MRTAISGLVAAFVLVAPVAAQSGLSPRERALGEQQSPELVAQFGGAFVGPQADYVRRVGQRIAGQSGVATRLQDYTVTLLNSNVSNAFALPGGYVYITRQLLALMNNEAELAFVMGHEVGHVAARHAQKRQTRSTITSLGAALLGAVTKSEVLGNVAGTGAQLYTLSYSRQQESEADRLGVGYLTRAGYDPQAAPAILSDLGTQDSLERQLSDKNEGQKPVWLSSHPATAARVAEARRLATELGQSQGKATLNRDAFLDAIDGMLYDADPAAGSVDGNHYRNSVLKIGFDVPDGVKLQQNGNAVSASIQQGQQAQFSTGRRRTGETLADYVLRAFAGLGASDRNGQRPGRVQSFRIGGLEAAVAALRRQTQAGITDITIAAYALGDSDVAQLTVAIPDGVDPGLEEIINRVHRLAPGETEVPVSRRIQVVRVRAGDTVQSLSANMAYPNERLTRFLVLNGLTDSRILVAGDRVKLVVRR